MRVLKAAGSRRLGSHGTDSGVRSACLVQHQHFAFTTSWSVTGKNVIHAEGERNCVWTRTEAASCCCPARVG